MRVYGTKSDKCTTVIRLPGYRKTFAAFGLMMSLLIAVGSVVSVVAAEEDMHVIKFVGKNWVNGRSWQKLEYSGKLGFVCGLFDGITLFYSVTDSERKTNEKDSIGAAYNSLSIPSMMTVGEVVFAMDDFYKDPENMALPAICAYLHLVYSSRGDPVGTVQKRLKVWRKMFVE